MQKLVILAGAALALAGSPLAAQSYAETASEVANAIRSGDTQQQRALLPQLTDVEFAEVAKLEGCDGALGGAGANDYVIVSWTCGEATAEPGLVRSTAMFFEPGGDLIGFAINRPLGELADPPGGTAERDLLREFGEALSDGEDPSLSGRIDIDAFDIARLEPYVGGSFRIMRRRTRSGQFRILLKPPGRSDERNRSALIAFAEDGTPSGILFTPTFVRSDHRSAVVERGLTGDNRQARPAVTGCVIC